MKYLLSCSHSDFIRGEKTAEDVAETCLYAGASGIEGYHTFFTGMDDRELEETRAVFADSSIGIRTFHLPCAKIPEFDLAGKDSAMREKAVDIHREWIRKAAVLGAEKCITHTTSTDTDAEGNLFDKVLDRFSASLEQVLREAEKNRVRIALENHNPSIPGRFGCRAEHFEKIRQRLDCETLGFCFDFGHAHLAYGNEYDGLFNMLSDRIIAFHLHDNIKLSDEHLPPGYGMIDWKKAKNLIAGSGGAYLCIEATPHPSMTRFLKSDWKKLVSETRELLE